MPRIARRGRAGSRLRERMADAVDIPSTADSVMTKADPVASHLAAVEANIARLGRATELQATSARWRQQTHALHYDDNFTWLGQPIRQLPQDIMALQEIIWRTRPDLIIETGMAQGGSLALFASLLQLLGDNGLAVGIDIDVSDHTRAALANHPLAHRMAIVQGSSTDADVASAMRLSAGNRRCVMVVLDSHQDEAHVLRELQLYAPLVTPGSYLVVCDTIVDHLEAGSDANAPWGPGNSPRSALVKYLATDDRFEIDHRIDQQLLLTNCPGGYLRRRS